MKFDFSAIYQNSEFWALGLGILWLIGAGLWPGVIPVTIDTQAGPISPSMLLGYAVLRIIGKTATPGAVPLQPAKPAGTE